MGCFDRSIRRHRRCNSLTIPAQHALQTTGAEYPYRTRATPAFLWKEGGGWVSSGRRRLTKADLEAMLEEFEIAERYGENRHHRE